MIVIYVLIISFLIFEFFRMCQDARKGGGTNTSWTTSLCYSIAAVFCVTGVSHFTELRFDMLQMLPPPVPKEMWVIHATGVLELLGALGFVIKRTRVLTGFCLIAFLICIFPANIYAALNDIPFNGRAPTPLLLRTAIQLLLIGLIFFVIRKNRIAPAEMQAAK